MADKRGFLSSSEAISELRRRRRDGSLRELWDAWKWIFSYTRKYRSKVFLYCLFGILGSTFSIGSAIAGKYTIDIITGYNRSGLVPVLLLMLGFMLTGILFNAIVSRISAKISVDVTHDIQKTVFSNLMDTDWLRITEYPGGDILSRFGTDAKTVASNAVSWLPDLLVSLYTAVASFLVILHYDTVMALIALLSAPLLLFVSRPFLRILRVRSREIREASSRMTAFSTEAFHNFDTVKSFELSDRMEERLTERQQDEREHILDYTDASIRANAAAGLSGSAVYLISFCYCLYLLWSGKILYGTMTLFLTQAGKLRSTIDRLARSVPGFLNAAVSAQRVKELMDLPRDSHSALPEGFCDKGGVSVAVDRVSFSYRAGQPVLKDVSFQAHPGEIIALVGPSGMGKTTVIRLLLGLIRPEKGSVTLSDGTDSLSASSDTRTLFSYVPQGKSLLSGSVAENLRLVKPEAADDEIREALAVTCALDFTEALPDGINGKIGENGIGLSDGQAQRIAIARAVLRDAPVLLLDEATSALDTATEREVLRNIMQRCPDKTCILTTHRPSVLNLCKRIYRVSDGSLTLLNEDEASRLIIDF